MIMKLNSPITLNLADTLKQAHIRPGNSAAREFEALFDLVQETAKPKALFKESFIENKEGDRVMLEGVVFTSPTLRHNLDQINRVFPYIATCGAEVDQVPIEQGDILKQVWLYTIKLSLLEGVIEHIKSEINQRFKYSKLSSMNPGSGDHSVWPIEQQQDLFSIFGDVEGQIGVKLLPSYLMQPDISASGIFFPTETTYQNCQLCRREECEYRSAAFDEKLWQSINQAG